jgi:hypothetical protein
VTVLRVAGLLMLAAVAVDAQPELELEGGRVVLGDLPPVLADDEVTRQLTTGLTATLAFRVEVAGIVGGCRIEIRYELWDEVFHVTTLEIDRPPASTTLASREALEEWWSRLRLAVVDPTVLDAASRPPPQVARVILEVVPFSHSEQLDTQRWFEESVQRAEQGKNEGISRSTEGGEESLGRVFSVLIATSIRRRAVTSYRWDVAWPGGDRP